MDTERVARYVLRGARFEFQIGLNFTAQLETRNS